ncbi:MAG: hypothetical protein ACYCSO_01950 [Cuniculiplasma sp.]
MGPEELKEKFRDEKEPAEIAEKIHELKKEGYQFLFSDRVKRLIVGEEWPFIQKGQESPYSEVMIQISEILGIRDRKSYEEVDDRYNLTMY